MKAGKTNLEVNTEVRIIDSDDVDMIGLTGLLTHPFNGHAAPNTNYIAGLRITGYPNADVVFKDNIVNLTKADKFIVVD